MFGREDVGLNSEDLPLKSDAPSDVSNNEHSFSDEHESSDDSGSFHSSENNTNDDDIDDDLEEEPDEEASFECTPFVLSHMASVFTHYLWTSKMQTLRLLWKLSNAL